MSLLDMRFDTPQHIEVLEQMTQVLKEGIGEARRHGYDVEIPHDIRQTILAVNQLEADEAGVWLTKPILSVPSRRAPLQQRYRPRTDPVDRSISLGDDRCVEWSASRNACTRRRDYATHCVGVTGSPSSAESGGSAGASDRANTPGACSSSCSFAGRSPSAPAPSPGSLIGRPTPTGRTATSSTPARSPCSSTRPRA
ncbi:hypothetical protein PF010_g2641 [Phytophthora fragariae]|uniref:Uncharacterized protein n=1 Tax=Phytophthora fragariae TaxID=53985 RepID=A0A6G0LWJ6_9STRA|nr:hypothetical protein PF010_g2641 [Phytophthora fragariae]